MKIKLFYPIQKKEVNYLKYFCNIYSLIDEAGEKGWCSEKIGAGCSGHRMYCKKTWQMVSRALPVHHPRRFQGFGPDERHARKF